MALTERFETYTKQALLNNRLRKAIKEKEAALLELGRACYGIRHLWRGMPELAESLAATEEADAVVKDCLRQLSALRGEILCPHCGGTLASDAVYCSYCGKKTAQPDLPEEGALYCPRCGEPAQPEHSFCTACGSILRETDNVRICLACGAEAAQGENYCPACGRTMPDFSGPEVDFDQTLYAGTGMTEELL